MLYKTIKNPTQIIENLIIFDVGKQELTQKKVSSC